MRKSDGMLEQVTKTIPPVMWEFIDSKELALRWSLPESWVRDQVRRRSPDPLPHVRFGKYVRFRWGSPELEGWAQRRIVGGNGSRDKREIIQ
jgi:hypothetical protein